jgi:hypothetical protein
VGLEFRGEALHGLVRERGTGHAVDRAGMQGPHMPEVVTMLQHPVDDGGDRLQSAVRVPLEAGGREEILGQREEWVGQRRVGRHDHQCLVVDLGVGTQTGVWW